MKENTCCRAAATTTAPLHRSIAGYDVATVSIAHIPGTYPQHRGKESQDLGYDSSDSDTGSANNEAPCGSASSAKISSLQLDKDVDALSSELLELRHTSPPGVPISTFSFTAPRAMGALPGDPPDTDSRNVFPLPKAGLLLTFFFEHAATPSTISNDLVKPGAEKSLFADFTKGILFHVIPNAPLSGGQGEHLFEERKSQAFCGGTTPAREIPPQYNVSTLFDSNVRPQPA
jgi:hypothetical protein